MKIVCSIDENCAVVVSPPTSFSFSSQEYFEKLISTRQCHGITVKENGDFGKGVYAKSDFKEDELILKDQMLVGAQHYSNRMECLVCSYCFKFIGSIEFQIGRKLYLQNLAGLVSSNHGCDASTSSHIRKDCSDTDSSEEEYIGFHEKEKVPLPEGVVESLMNDELVLPYSDKFLLPEVVSCPGGCREAYYCSKSCGDADWESFHSLLCTGEKSELLSREALAKFIQHANGNFIDRFKAWKPISIGYKQRWWDSVALPDDVDCSDEVSFRMLIKELAFTSLQLLKAAIFDKEFEALFSLGMFELNNLGLVVASPVEDYFLFIDDLPRPQKKEAEKISRLLLDGLGDKYSVCCEGTAFYPLQSCTNHSCCPNGKAFQSEEDRDGQATILCNRPIFEGEEITISYIDEDLPYEERQALLADYGFKCKCPKCNEEQPQ